MEVTIVGTGDMARAIATRMVTAGYSVTLHGKTREEAETLARELRKNGADGEAVNVGVSGDEIPGEVVVFALWYEDVADIISSYGNRLDDKIVIDITNPIDRTVFEPLVLADGSAAQEIARLVPDGAKVVKAFNTTLAGTLMAGEVAGESLDVFVAGDDEDAKWTVAQLIEEAGLRAIDAGPLRRAQQLEGMGYLHMALQAALGTDYGSAIKILP